MRGFEGECRDRGARTGVLAASIGGTVWLMASASAPSPFYPLLADCLAFPPAGTAVVFAIYAFTLLGILLSTGSLSDRVGRRPVSAVGAVLLALSLLVFWRAGNFETLMLARALQGVAAGLLIPALSAILADSRAAEGAGSAAIWNTIAPMTGLAAGALGSAVVLDMTSVAAIIVFGTLIAGLLVLAVGIWALPETAMRAGRVTVPSRRHRLAGPVRAMLWRTGPAIAAGWANERTVPRVGQHPGSRRLRRFQPRPAGVHHARPGRGRHRRGLGAVSAIRDHDPPVRNHLTRGRCRTQRRRTVTRRVPVVPGITAIFAWRLRTGSLGGNTPTPYPVVQGRLSSDDQVEEPHR